MTLQDLQDLNDFGIVLSDKTPKDTDEAYDTPSLERFGDHFQRQDARRRPTTPDDAYDTPRLSDFGIILSGRIRSAERTMSRKSFTCFTYDPRNKFDAVSGAK